MARHAKQRDEKELQDANIVSCVCTYANIGPNCIRLDYKHNLKNESVPAPSWGHWGRGEWQHAVA